MIFINIQQQPKRFMLLLFLVAFAVNWFWEMLQMPWYRELDKIGFPRTVIFCTIATFGDAVLTVAGYEMGKFITRQFLFMWISLFGAVSAIGIEIAALNLGLWSYAPSMPMVPFFEIGLLPFLQLLILMPLSLAMTKFFEAEKEVK